MSCKIVNKYFLVELTNSQFESYNPNAITIYLSVNIYINEDKTCFSEINNLVWDLIKSQWEVTGYF